MDTVTFKNLNWAFILDCFNRSDLSKKQFYEQILPRLCPKAGNLPAISTFYFYLRQQAVLSSASSKKRKATPKRVCAFSRAPQLGSLCLKLISIFTLEHSSTVLGTQDPLKVLWLRLIASVLNVPPWYAGRTANTND